MSDYYQKYIKYKNKYLNIQKKLNGGTLENLSNLCNVLLTSPKDVSIKHFTKYIEKYIFPNEITRQERYDIHFLSALMMLLHGYSESIYLINSTDKTKKYNVNADIKCCNTEDKFTFFMEDIYTDDLEKFIFEYDNFVKTKQSAFFFKSNLVNISKMLKCYYKRCYDDFLNINIDIEQNISTSFDTDKMYRVFIENKNILCKTLSDAYLTCNYNNVLSFYIEYMNFYDKAVGEIEQIEQYGNTEEENGTVVSNETFIEWFKTNMTADKDYYIYFSCVHVSEDKQTRFYMTKMMDTYIGHHYVHEELVNSIATIMHDVFVHGNHNRISRLTPDELIMNRTFILSAFKELDKDIFKLLMKNIQNIQNEKYGINAVAAVSHAKRYNRPIKETKVILNGEDGKKFLYEEIKDNSKNRMLISQQEINNYERLIKWLGGKGIATKNILNDFYSIE